MRYGKYRFIASFLALPLLLYVVFVVSPYVQAFTISMTDWRGFSGERTFIGLGNYVELVHDPRLWRAMAHNAALLVVVPAVTIGIALFLAMMTVGGRRGAMVRGVRGSRVYQVLYFFPFIVPVVIAGVLFGFVYNPEAGLLNGFLRLVGFDWLTRAWLGDTTFALPAVMAVIIWAGVGFYYVLFSAAMKAVPNEIYEAAVLDGAGLARTFRHITLPMIRDSVQVSAIHLGIVVLDAFALLQVMLPDGGPDNSTEVVAQYLYRAAFTEGRFGYASAIGVLLCFVTLLLAVAVLRLTRRERIEY